MLPINTKSELFEILRACKDQANRLGVHRIGVFGSFVRNEVREKSDVDLIVDFEPGMKTFDNFMDLVFLLEDLTGRKVQILTWPFVSSFIGPYILKEIEYA